MENWLFFIVKRQAIRFIKKTTVYFETFSQINKKKKVAVPIYLSLPGKELSMSFK